MNRTSAQRLLIDEPAAWSLLSPPEQTVLKLLAMPTLDGKRRSVSGLCEGLGISRAAFYKNLKRARRKCETITAEIQATADGLLQANADKSPKR